MTAETQDNDSVLTFVDGSPLPKPRALRWLFKDLADETSRFNWLKTAREFGWYCTTKFAFRLTDKEKLKIPTQEVWAMRTAPLDKSLEMCKHAEHTLSYVGTRLSLDEDSKNLSLLAHKDKEGKTQYTIVDGAYLSVIQSRFPKAEIRLHEGRSVKTLVFFEDDTIVATLASMDMKREIRVTLKDEKVTNEA